MVGCSVLGCKSRSERKIEGITFHTFPSNLDRKKWQDATGHKNWLPTKYSKICSIHFDEDSFLYKNKRVQLKPHSVPTKFICDFQRTKTVKNIVSKKPSKIKKKIFRCDLCVRKFASLYTLKSHQRFLHKLRPVLTRRPHENVAKEPVAKVQTVKNPIVMEVRVTSERSRFASDSAKEETAFQNRNRVMEEPQSPKVDFECPKCFLSFNTYLVAAQHIQKFHYADRKVPLNVLPERKELCLKCERKVKSLTSHICSAAEWIEDLSSMYRCMACSVKFNNKRLFYAHIMTNHSQGVESLFFPSSQELTKWKQDMEDQTDGRYSQFQKIDTKCFAHCIHSFRHNSMTNKYPTVDVCPSIIVLQEFSKGVQIHFYSQHHSHALKNYTIPKKFKKYSITSFLKASDSYFQMKDLRSDSNDPYVQFKQLMESIILDAAKLKKETLSTLFGKALEMMSILTAYDNDDDMSDDGIKLINRSMTDNDIEKALEDPSILDKNDTGPDKKKWKQAPSPMILNTFSLADNTDNAKENKIKVKDLRALKDAEPSYEVKEEPKDKTKNLDSTPSSFSESFEVFVEKNFQVEDQKYRQVVMEAGKMLRRPGRPVVKTRIGQYKPPSPKKSTTDTQHKINKDIPAAHQQGVQDSEACAPKQPPTVVPKELLDSLSSVYTKRKSNDNLSQRLQTVHEPSHLPVTKLIDSPSKHVAITNKYLSQKHASSQTTFKVRPKPKPDKPKIDFVYEVKERHDDCNILILKM